MIELKPILLVEDNPNDEELTLEALGEHNLANAVQVVRDGEEALDFFFKRKTFANRQNGNPAVVLLDLKLPKVSGLEVLRAIRQDDRLKLTPVVVLTSSREESDRIEAYGLGVNAYVVKPVDFKQFICAVSKLGVFWAVINEPPPGSTRRKA
jgi:CheY-like chemotaxis protein